MFSEADVELPKQGDRGASVLALRNTAFRNKDITDSPVRFALALCVGTEAALKNIHIIKYSFADANGIFKFPLEFIRYLCLQLFWI